MTPFTESWAQVRVEVRSIYYVGWPVGLWVPNERDSLPPCERGYGAVCPPVEGKSIHSWNCL